MIIFWIIFIVLIGVPLFLHVRGKTVVALSLSVVLMYLLAILAALSTAVLTAIADLFISMIRPPTVTKSDFYDDTYFVAGNAEQLLAPMLIFMAIALVFWLLARWGAPLPHDALKTLFWMLHITVLALPFAAAAMMSAGMPRSYLEDTNGANPMVVATSIVSLLTFIAVIGFIWIAVKATFQRIRA
ncbi:hypothetical protein Q4555_11415 [Octadecabacter sp. 1_MG-2023]|uniref:hypothetical protein n=1 Tax=unclassified Octadecabacter TaxID=196158 RepID=UPI001C09C642|nr:MULTISPECIES: hypothetical protein [unclassified Octadecabacter]MBU2993876.1 hypothetical protein [Octadecabacter sp. B2R22]MDO6735278.1 hypothetical protein [Octadecabacter sp. 1_MG-2023]